LRDNSNVKKSACLIFSPSGLISKASYCFKNGKKFPEPAEGSKKYSSDILG